MTALEHSVSAREIGHVPVLLAEVVEALAPRDDAVYVDGTFGAGGYTRAFLEAARCTVYGIDRDPGAIERGRSLADRYGDRLRLVLGRFGQMDTLLAEQGTRDVDGVALDLGVSSMQIDDAERGFSFQKDGPLDMRMGGEGPSASDVVNTLPEADLARILWIYGEERRSRAVARAIVEARREKPITRTGELSEIVARVVGRGVPGIHPATRTFQALRIYVNGELEEIASGLGAAERLLKPGGRLAVVSFHSLEDRVVKRFFRQRSGREPTGSRHSPQAAGPGSDGNPRPSFRMIERGARAPGAAEIAANPRSRSARLRTAERTAAPPVPVDPVQLAVPQLAIGGGRS